MPKCPGLPDSFFYINASPKQSASLFIDKVEAFLNYAALSEVCLTGCLSGYSLCIHVSTAVTAVLCQQGS